MSWNPFKKHHSAQQPRNENNQFIAKNPEKAASVTDNKSMDKQIDALGKTIESAYGFVNKLNNSVISQIKAQQEIAELQKPPEVNGNQVEMNPMEMMLMTAMANRSNTNAVPQGQPQAQVYGGGDAWNGSQPIPQSSPPPIEPPQPEPQEKPKEKVVLSDTDKKLIDNHLVKKIPPHARGYIKKMSPEQMGAVVEFIQEKC